MIVSTAIRGTVVSNKLHSMGFTYVPLSLLHPPSIPFLTPTSRPPKQPLPPSSHHLRPQHIPPKLLLLQHLQCLQCRARIRKILHVGRAGPVEQILEVGDEGRRGEVFDGGGSQIGEVGG